jgi:hypothetical protein
MKDLLRRILNELAYACDYDKGGDTVTAIGLESRPDRYVYWVAANTCPKKKIVPFLESLLTQLKTISSNLEKDCISEVNKLALHLIDFATPRIKKYWQHLRPLLGKCHKYLGERKDSDHGKLRGPCTRIGQDKSIADIFQ